MLINKQLVKLVCDAPSCMEESIPEGWDILPGCPPLIPWVPDGWTKIGDRVFCGKHTLVLSVDGTEVGL